MSEQPDLDERFSLHPRDPEEVLRRILDGDDRDGDEPESEPVDDSESC